MGGEGAISNLEYNLIIMPMPLKMSRLPWESIISKAIMSFMAHKEKGEGGHRGAVPALKQRLGLLEGRRERLCVFVTEGER